MAACCCSSRTQRKISLPPRRASPRTHTRCPYHGCHGYCTSRIKGLWVLRAPVVQPATHALNPELSQPRGVRKPLGEPRFAGRRMINAATEADGGNAGRWKAWKTIKAVFHPSHQPWKSIKPISTFPPSRRLRQDELISKTKRPKGYAF